MFICFSVALITSVRSLLSYQNIFSALVDALITLVSLFFAALVMHSGHGAIWAIWTFFLVQSLTALIPRKLCCWQKPLESGERRFLRAHRAAEEALERLINTGAAC
jgi:hypothetical protein